MCNHVKSDTYVNGNKDFSKEELDSKEDYSKDELKLYGNKDSSHDNELYNGEESDGDESNGVNLKVISLIRTTMTSNSISLVGLMTLHLKRQILFWMIR